MFKNVNFKVLSGKICNALKNEQIRAASREKLIQNKNAMVGISCLITSSKWLVATEGEGFGQTEVENWIEKLFFASNFAHFKILVKVLSLWFVLPPKC